MKFYLIFKVLYVNSPIKVPFRADLEVLGVSRVLCSSRPVVVIVDGSSPLGRVKKMLGLLYSASPHRFLNVSPWVLLFFFFFRFRLPRGQQCNSRFVLSSRCPLYELSTRCVLSPGDDAKGIT